MLGLTTSDVGGKGVRVQGIAFVEHGCSLQPLDVFTQLIRPRLKHPFRLEFWQLQHSTMESRPSDLAYAIYWVNDRIEAAKFWVLSGHVAVLCGFCRPC